MGSEKSLSSNYMKNKQNITEKQTKCQRTLQITYCVHIGIYPLIKYKWYSEIKPKSISSSNTA